MGSFLAKFFVDPTTLPDDGFGFIQLLSLLVVYGYILSISSGLISDGSELLLLIPSLAGIVGSIVLPILGAVPDGAIVLFSGLGKDAQEQVTVGVGALAGSTIMVLTIPWALSIIHGRVAVVDGVADYKNKRIAGKPWSLLAGVTPRRSVMLNGRLMVATSAAYFIIQGAAFGVKCDEKNDKHCHGSSEHWFALAALIVAGICFAGYLVYNVWHADDEDKQDRVEEVKKQAIDRHIVSLSTAFEKDLARLAEPTDGLMYVADPEKRFNDTLRSFFNRYDRNGDGVIDRYELRVLLNDLNESFDDASFEKLLSEIDTDQSGTIEFSEFTAAMKVFVRRKNDLMSSSGDNLSVQTERTPLKKDEEKGEGEGGEDDEGDDDEEEAEVPEDLAHLTPAQQRRRVLFRSFWMMGLGTLVVLLISDPMVDVLSELGDRIHVPAFYVAFVLGPIASNASELIAAINYAGKRTKKTITISMGTLLGAACMNNTFCLGIFLCLIFFKGLIWEFSAETISIIFVELALFIFSLKTTYRVYDAILILSLYPFSIFLVWLLENVAGLN